MIDTPRLFGAAYSVYVRIVRLTLHEKAVAFEHIPVDVFAMEGPPAAYLTLHPFGRIPALDHRGFSLYETGAITRYIDEAFPGPDLQPRDVFGRARCSQLISIADNYAYPQMVWGIYVERVAKPGRGEPTDATRVATAFSIAKTCLAAMSNLMGINSWLAGPQLSLADLYAAPMFAYFLRDEVARDMLRQYPNLDAWWSRMAARPSMSATDPG